MNIGVDIRTLSFRKGGLSHYTYNLLKNVARMDSKNIYFLFNYNKSPYEWDNFKGNVEEIILRLPQRHNLKTVWETIVIPLSIKKLGIDVWFSPTDFYIPPLFQKSSVITIHDLLCKNTFDSEKKQYVKQSTNKTKLDRSVKRASKIIAISHFTYGEVRKEYGTESSKMFVIYSAADERFHKINNQTLLSKVLRRYGINFSYILFVGETSERKNLVRLLHAYHLLKDENRLKKRKLLIVGKRTIDTDQILRTVNVLGLSSDVLFTGYIPDEDLPFIYNAADLFVFPSLYEGFGLPLLEAMSCQVPVAASNSTSIPEIVGDGALLFNPYDERDIAVKIDMVVNEKMDVGELKRKALIQTDKFSWGKTAEGVIEIIDSLNGRH